MDRLFFGVGALSALISVAAGAFGAHALRARLTPDYLAVFETAARYQMYHALALFAVAWAVTRWPGGLAVWAGWLFVAGTVALLRQSLAPRIYRDPMARSHYTVRRSGLPCRVAVSV